jgi:hypothetical protein
MATTYEPIATATGTTSTITFSSIPSTYTDLRLSINARVNNQPDAFFIRINGDNASNYSSISIISSGGTPSVGQFANSSWMLLASVNTAQTEFGSYQFDFFGYANSINKTVLISTNNNINSASTGNGLVASTIGMWRNTAAITSISFTSVNMNGFDNTTMYYTATLYGIKAA